MIRSMLFAITMGALLATSVACDRGRVIDEAERSRVLTGKTPDTSTTGALSIGRGTSAILSRQGNYFFSLWDTRNGGFVSYPIVVESLLRLDSARVPQLTISQMSFDMTCAETVGPDCIRWTRTLSLATDIAITLPAVDMTVSLFRRDRFQLEANLGGGNQIVANYETFDIEFTLGTTTRSFPLVKQNYVDDLPLALLSQGWPSIVGYEDFDLLLSGFVLLPSTSYGFQAQDATRQILAANRWQIDWPFLNVASGATQAFTYIFEKL